MIRPLVKRDELVRYWLPQVVGTFVSLNVLVWSTWSSGQEQCALAMHLTTIIPSRPPRDSYCARYLASNDHPPRNGLANIIIMDSSHSITGKAQGSTGLSVQSFLSSSAVYLVICVAVLTYELKGTRSCHPISLGIFLRWSRDWQDLIAQYGADRYFLIRLFRTAIKIFIPLSIVLTTSLLPIDITASDSGAVTGLDRLSWANLETGQTGRLWGNALAATGTMSFVCYVLVGEFRDLISIRQHYLLQLATLSTAVLVTDVPPKKMTEDGLRAHYASFNGGPTGVWIYRDDDPVIYTQLRQRETLERKLESHLTKQFYRNQKATSWVIEEDEKLRSLATEYQALQKRIGDPLKHPRASSGPSALVQFKDAITPHLVQQAVQSSQVMRMIPHQIQSTEDIILPNITLSWQRRLLQRLAVEAVIVGFCLFVSVPIGLTGSLSQISYLAGRVPLVARLLSSTSGSRWLAVIQGLLPQVLLSVIITVAPRLISASVARQAHVTFTTQEMSIAGYYFLFLYIQIFLVVSLASSLTTVVPEALKYPASVPTILADNIPKSINYFYSYLMLQCITQCSLSLRRLPNKLWCMVSSRLAPQTPREIWEAQRSSIRWGIIYPVFTNLACICKLLLPSVTIFINILWVSPFLLSRRSLYPSASPPS